MVKVDINSEIFSLDSLDKKILGELKKNSRVTLSQLGRKIHIGRDTCNYRLGRLEKRGIIDKYSVKANFKNFGYDEYNILLQLFEFDEKDFKDFFEYLNLNKKVSRILLYNGKWDLRIVVRAKGLREFDAFVNNLIDRFSQLIDDYIVLEKVYSFNEKGLKQIKLDKKDKQILNFLFLNSRMKVIELNNKINLSSDAIIKRIRKYKKFSSFTISLNVSKLGLQFYTLLVEMKKFSKREENLLKSFSNKDYIEEVSKVIGSWNILISILARDNKEVYSIIRNLRKTFSGSLKDLDLLIAYKEIKNYDFIY